MKAAVIYARYSSERQTEQSIEGQLRVCNDYAERNDLKIVGTYIDRAMTGKNDNRKDFQRMLRDCSKHEWEIVLVYKLDRFSRNKYEMAIHRKTLRDNGVRLVSAMENIPDSPEGIILESLIEAMAEYYSVELAQKVRRGQIENLKKGKWLGGQILYGYKAENKRLVIDEEKAKIVVYIYEQYFAGKIVPDIIADLTAKGIYHLGKPFKKCVMYYILSNEKYSGIFHYQGEIYDNVYPKIVPDYLFKAVQSMMAKNKLGRNSKDMVYYLRGKVFCGYCGRRINAETGTSMNGEIKYYYKCGGRKDRNGCTKKTLRKDELEQLVIDTTIKVLDNNDNLSAIADKIMAVHEAKMHDRSVLNLLLQEEQATQKAIDNMLTAIQQGIITDSTKKRMEDLEDKLQTVRQKILAEQATIENQLTKEKIIDYLKSGIKKKPQAMLNLLINKIILYDDKIEIHYNYTENNDPDGDDRDFVLYAALIQDIKKQTKPNLIVQLSLSWLPLADSNCRHCG